MAANPPSAHAAWLRVACATQCRVKFVFPPSTFKELLDAIPKTAAAVGAVIAALSATLIKQELIPENLAILGVSASLLVVLAVILGTVKQEALERRSATLAAVATLCLVVLIVVQLTWVVTADPYGPDNGARKFLVGYSLTDDGRRFAPPSAVFGEARSSPRSATRRSRWHTVPASPSWPGRTPWPTSAPGRRHPRAHRPDREGLEFSDPLPVPTPPTPPTPPAPPPTP